MRPRNLFKRMTTTTSDRLKVGQVAPPADTLSTISETETDQRLDQRTAHEPKITAEALADLEVPRDVKLSPSGTCVTYSLHPESRKKEHSTASIWLAEVGYKNSARQLTSGLFNDCNPQWSPSSKSIAFCSDRATPGKQAALYILPFAARGEAYALTSTINEKHISKFAWSPDGRYIAFLSPDETTASQKSKAESKNDVKVFGLDLEYNRLRLVDVQSKHVMTLISKAAHINNFAWSPDSSQIVYSIVSSSEISAPYVNGTILETLSLDNELTPELCHFPTWIQDLSWSESRIFWRSSYDETSYLSSNAVYGMKLTDPKWTRFMGGKDECIYSMANCDGKLVLLRQKEMEDALVSLSGQNLCSGEVEISSFDVLHHEANPLIAVVNSDGNAPKEVSSIMGGKETRLSQHGKAIAAITEVNVSAYSAIAKDGAPLDGIIITPAHLDESIAHPTIVLIHSGPYSRTTCSFDPIMFNWAQYLASAGYQILCPNYRGNSSRGEEYAAVLKGQVGGKDYGDVILLIENAIDEGLIDKERVAIGGWSQGGYISYLSTTRDRRFHFRAAVCGAGISDWDMFQMTSDAFTVGGELSGRVPWESYSEQAQGRRGSPLWHMADIKTPVLILHGEEDDVVPVSQAIAFNRGCVQKGLKCQMAIYPREGHGVSKPFERAHYVDMLERMKAFYDEHMK